MDALNKQVGQAIQAQRSELAEAIVERQYLSQPELVARYGEMGRAKCLQDSLHHLASISSAITLSTPAIFVEYVAWARRVLAAHGIPSEDLARNLVCIRDALHDGLEPALATVAVEYVNAALSQLLRSADHKD